MVGQDRETFVADRRKGIGGSDCAAVLGLDERKTRYQLWREKLGIDVVAEKAAMRRGQFLESAIIRRYFETVKPANILPAGRQYVDDWRRGNVDALAWDSEGRLHIVEAKSVTRRVFRDDWGEPWSDEVPDRALCQGLWYGNLATAFIIDFAVCVIPDDPDVVLGCTPEEVLAESDFHVFQAPRNEDVEAMLVDRARSFWFENVVPKVPPTLETVEDVELRWPATTQGLCKYGEPILDLLREYERACEADGAAKKLREKLREKILLYAEDAEALMANDGRTPWLLCKSGERESFVMPASKTRTLRFTKWWRKLSVTQPNKEN